MKNVRRFQIQHQKSITVREGKVKITTTVEMNQTERDLFVDKLACHTSYSSTHKSFVSSSKILNIINDMLQNAFDIGRSYDSEV